MKMILNDMLANKKKVFIWVVIIAVAVALLSLYFSGYRLSKHFHLTSPSTVILKNVDADSTIIIDRKKVSSKMDKNNEIVLNRLPVGEHEIIVSVKNRWPWTKRVNIESKEVLALSPFTTPQNSSGEIIPANDPEYESISASIANFDAGKTILSNDKKFTITTDINRIIANSLEEGGVHSNLFCKGECTNSRIVFTAMEPISSLAFYPNRDDVVLVAIHQNVFALELDDDGIQNIQPIFTGVSPKFSVSTSTNTVFVQDQSTLFAVHL